MYPIALALGACTLASVVSSSFVDFSRTPTSDLVPRKGAFSIWGLVYTLLVASAVVLGSARGDAPDPVPHVLVCTALAITCVWSATVTRAPRVAFAALVASALAVWTALPFVRGHLLYFATYGLLAGWLAVAVTISTGINDTRALLGASVAVGAASVGLAAPWPCASLLWGLVLQRVVWDPAVVAAILVTVCAAAGATVRRYA